MTDIRTETTLHLRPARVSVDVLNPATLTPLPAEGAAVTDSAYWRRRLRDGSAVMAPTPPMAPTVEDMQAQEEYHGHIL